MIMIKDIKEVLLFPAMKPVEAALNTNSTGPALVASGQI
jgi:hypothetical protein